METWTVMNPSCYAMLLDLIKEMNNRERKLNKRGIRTQWKDRKDKSDVHGCNV